MNALEILIQRIADRPAIELKNTIRDFATAIPSVDGKPVIAIVERTEHREGLGECLFTIVAINDPILGQQEHILHVYELAGIVKKKLGAGNFRQFVEAVDHDGGPLFPSEPIKQAVLECLKAVDCGRLSDSQDEWLSITQLANLIEHSDGRGDIVPANRSTVSKWQEDPTFPPMNEHDKRSKRQFLAWVATNKKAYSVKEA